jgi:hypothetical protein
MRRYGGVWKGVLGFLFVMVPAEAGATEIMTRQCVPAGVKNVHTLFTRYDKYSSLPGSEYNMNLAGVDITLMKMTKSQAKVLTQTDQTSQHYVWVVLQPVNLTNGSLYPRFLLDCKVDWLSAERFKQSCGMMRDKQHFGLDELRISVEAAAAASGCRASETDVRIRVTLQANGKQVKQIKDAVLAPAGILAPLIEQMFDEEEFFKGYFDFLYSEWLKTL